MSKRASRPEGWSTLPNGVLTRGNRWYIKKYKAGWALYTRDCQTWGDYDSLEDALSKRRRLLRKWKSEGTYDAWLAKVRKIKLRDRKRNKRTKKRK